MNEIFYVDLIRIFFLIGLLLLGIVIFRGAHKHVVTNLKREKDQNRFLEENDSILDAESDVFYSIEDANNNIIVIDNDENRVKSEEEILKNYNKDEIESERAKNYLRIQGYGSSDFQDESVEIFFNSLPIWENYLYKHIDTVFKISAKKYIVFVKVTQEVKSIRQLSGLFTEIHPMLFFTTTNPKGILNISEQEYIDKISTTNPIYFAQEHDKVLVKINKIATIDILKSLL